jgi:hypothetical protein
MDGVKVAFYFRNLIIKTKNKNTTLFQTLHNEKVSATKGLFYINIYIYIRKQQ